MCETGSSQHSLFSSTPPTLEEWLSVPKTSLAPHISSHNLSVLLSNDGTRREMGSERVSSVASSSFGTAQTDLDLFDLLFSLGVNTVLNLVLLPNDFLKNTEALQKDLKQTALFYSEKYQNLYAKYQLTARLFGDSDLASLSPPALYARPFLEELRLKLEQLTPMPTPAFNGLTSDLENQNSLSPKKKKKLLLGYYVDSFLDEIRIRSWQAVVAKTKSATGEEQTTISPPSLSEIRNVCFPFGPDKLDILLNVGRLNVRTLVPPVLDGGATNIFNLSYSSLVAQPEDCLRRILYAHFFPFPHHENLKKDSLIGQGRVIGPGIRYKNQPDWKWE